MNLLSLKEAIAIMESGQPFAVRFVSYDKKRKKGGQIRFFSELVTTRNSSIYHPAQSKRNTPKSKAQNHSEHMTRNFYQCISGRPTSVVKSLHLYGLLEINGTKVAL